MMQSLHQRKLVVQATQQYNADVEAECGEMRGGQNSGSSTCTMDFAGKRMEENLRMNGVVLMSVADKLRSFLSP